MTNSAGLPPSDSINNIAGTFHCSHPIYLYDQYPNPYIARWLGNSTKEFADAYALTELIQLVWRSRVRRGEPIIVYLPSSRMRALFETWLREMHKSSGNRMKMSLASLNDD